MDAFEREERDLDEQLEQGEITGQEHTEGLNELERTAREAAQDDDVDEIEEW